MFEYIPATDDELSNILERDQNSRKVIPDSTGHSRYSTGELSFWFRSNHNLCQSSGRTIHTHQVPEGESLEVPGSDCDGPDAKSYRYTNSIHIHGRLGMKGIKCKTSPRVFIQQVPKSFGCLHAFNQRLRSALIEYLEHNFVWQKRYLHIL